jgi:hypothetical protein
MTDKTARIVRQLFALALNQSASSGEIATSSQKIVEILRKDGATVDDLSAVFAAPARKLSAEPALNTACLRMVMPFGKHKGMTVGWLVKFCPDYLDWVLENCDNLRPRLRTAIEEALDNFAQ